MRWLPVLCALLTLLLAPAASGTVTPITTTADGKSPGTLRYAITNATGSDSVNVPAGTYTLTEGTIFPQAGLTITGAGASSTTINAGDASGILYASGTLSVSGITFTHGKAKVSAGNGGGGAIEVVGTGTLTVINSAFSANSAALSNSDFSGGGAIYVNGGASASVSGSTFSGNTVTADLKDHNGGGAVFVGGGAALTLSADSFSGDSFTQTNAATTGLDGGGATYAGATTISGSTFSGESASVTAAAGTILSKAGGGAVFSTGATAIDASTFSADATTVSAAGGIYYVSESGGGGLFSGAGATATASTFSGDTATIEAALYGNGGGGLYSSGGALSITASTLASNSVVLTLLGVPSDGGGGIYNNGTTTTILNTTLSGNSVSATGGPNAAAGGALYNLGGTGGTISNATVAENSVVFPGVKNVAYGGGIYESGASGTLALHNSILAGNSVASGLAGGANCYAGMGSTTISSTGHNIEDAATCGLSGPGDQPNTDPLLGPLQDNGGPTFTRELLLGSPAIDRGDNAGCPASDQRGLARPQGAACDIGALEVAPPSASTGAATGVGTTSATLGGSAGNPSVAGGSAYFQFGTSAAYGSQTPAQTLAAGASGMPLSIPLSNLTPGVVYHFRAVATTPDGTRFGADQTFTTASPPAAPVSAPPRITNVTQSNRSWREGTRLASFSRKHPLPPLGTTFSLSLNEQASVRLVFTQQTGGRTVGGKCVPPTNRNHRRHACRRTVIRGTLVFTAHAGKNKVSFQGRISRSKKLPPGAYTLVLTATNAAGQRSAPSRLSFTIVK